MNLWNRSLMYMCSKDKEHQDCKKDTCINISYNSKMVSKYCICMYRRNTARLCIYLYILIHIFNGIKCLLQTDYCFAKYCICNQEVNFCDVIIQWPYLFLLDGTYEKTSNTQQTPITAYASVKLQISG